MNLSVGFAVSALKPVMRIVSGLDLGPVRYPYRSARFIVIKLLSAPSSELSGEEEQQLRTILEESGLQLFK